MNKGLPFKSEITEDNSELLLTINNIDYPLQVPIDAYETNVIRHVDSLPKVIQEVIDSNGIQNIDCILGVVADGVNRKGHIVFEHKDDMTVTIGGSITSLIGEMSS